MSFAIYNWDLVDWKKQDAVIARELGCSRERVRQKRVEDGIGKSMYHRYHYGHMKSKILALDTECLKIEDVMGQTGCSKPYAVNILNKNGRKYIKTDKRVGGKYRWNDADWALTDRQVANQLGVPNKGVVSQHRYRLGIFKNKNKDGIENEDNVKESTFVYKKEKVLNEFD